MLLVYANSANQIRALQIVVSKLINSLCLKKNILINGKIKANVNGGSN